MGVDTDLGTLIRDLEEQLLDPDVRRSRTDLDRLLADDFIEYGASGRVFDKQSIITALRVESAPRRSIGDFRLRRLGPDVVLATFRVDVHTEAETGSPSSLRSSIWRRSAGRWQLVFHQGTPAP